MKKSVQHVVGSDNNGNPRIHNVQHVAFKNNKVVQPQILQNTIRDTSKKEIQNNLISKEENITKDLQSLPLFISSVFINETDLPMLSVTNELFGNVTTLIDSGAAKNFIDQEFIKKHNLEHHLESTIHNEAVAADNKSLKILGEIVLHIQFQLQGTWKQEDITFIVLENLSHPIILGVPFVRLYGNKIDWSNIDKQEEIADITELIDDYSSMDEATKQESDNTLDQEAVRKHIPAEDKENYEHDRTEKLEIDKRVQDETNVIELILNKENNKNFKDTEKFTILNIENPEQKKNTNSRSNKCKENSLEKLDKIEEKFKTRYETNKIIRSNLDKNIKINFSNKNDYENLLNILIKCKIIKLPESPRNFRLCEIMKIYSKNLDDHYDKLNRILNELIKNELQLKLSNKNDKNIINVLSKENNKSDNLILNHDNNITKKLPYKFKYSKDLNRIIKQPIYEKIKIELRDEVSQKTG